LFVGHFIQGNLSMAALGVNETIACELPVIETLMPGAILV
jgi:hypothetical protein